MILFRQKRQLIALWSCVLILFSALAPAISQTLAAHGNQILVACSMLNQLSGINTGSQYMPLSVKTAAAPSDYNMVAGQHKSHEPSNESSQVAHAHAGKHAPDHIALNTSPEALPESGAEHDQETSDHESPAHGMVHCPYCNLMHHSPVFLTGNAPQLLSGNLSYEMPALYYHAPRPLFAWAAIQPRGPPTLS